MPFRDRYTNFNFNNQDSSAFKVWVTNNRDIQIALTPNFSDSFTAPQFGGVRYLNGTTIDKTDISVKCIAINVNMNEWRAICNWLAPNKIGKLNFDFNKNSYYNVKLSKGVNSNSFYNTGIGDRFNGDYRNIEFNLEFTTVGDYAAIGNMNWASLLCDSYVWVREEGVEGRISWEEWLKSAGKDCLGRAVNVLPDVSEVPENCFVRLRGTNTIHFVDDLGEGLVWQVVSSARWEEEEYNYFNNYYFRNYALEPQLLSTESYAGGLTVDLRSSLAQEGTYNLGFPSGESTYITALELKKNETETEVSYTYKFSFSQESEKAFSGLFMIPEGYYFISTTSSEEKLPTIPISHCFNLGEYDEYPIIKLNNVTTGFEVYFNDELFYRYEFNTDAIKNNIIIDTKTSFIEYRGKLLEMARSYSGSPILKKSYNNGIVTLSTGNPELHLAKVVSNEDDSITLLLDSPLINSYNVERLGIAMFTGRANNTPYGSSVYEGDPETGATYPYKLDNYSFAINCTMEEISGRNVTIKLGQKTGSFNYSAESKVYVSFCSANTMKIVDLADSYGTIGSITGTYASASRGAI